MEKRKGIIERGCLVRLEGRVGMEAPGEGLGLPPDGEGPLSQAIPEVQVSTKEPFRGSSLWKRQRKQLFSLSPSESPHLTCIM